MAHDSPDWNPALAGLRSALDEARKTATDPARDSQVSITVAPSPTRSLRPTRLALAVLDRLPPWGRVVVVLAALAAGAAAAAYGWL